MERLSKQNIITEGLKKPSVKILLTKPEAERLGRLTKSPIFASMEDVARDPLAMKEAKELLTEMLVGRNESPNTRKDVFLSGFRKVALYDSESDSSEKSRYFEMEFSIPEGLAISDKLLKEINELHAREIWKEEKGTHDELHKDENEYPKYCFARVWDYDSLDKRTLGIKYMKDENKKEYGILLEPDKKKRRENSKTGTIIYFGREELLELPSGYRYARFKDKEYRYSDDVSARSGILLFDERPNNARKYTKEPFNHLPTEMNGCGVIKKVIFRAELGRSPSIEEIDLYYIGILLSDVLSGRSIYGATEGDLGSVGYHYKEEISATMARLNSSRYKNLSLETLPGVEEIAGVISEHLLEPLGEGRLEDAQDILIVGTPGTGKTAITTAFSRMDTGAALVSVSSREFLKYGESILDELVKFYDRYGIYTALVLQDAESLFTNALILGSKGEGAPVDPDKRQFVLDVLNGERNTKVKFILTINKPGYIDEALRRRFLTLYVGLPDKEDVDLYNRIASASLLRLIPSQEKEELRQILTPMLAQESLGYPPAFVAKVAEMLISPLNKLNGKSNDIKEISRIVNTCSERLKAGYPIKEIEELDIVAQEIGSQRRSRK